MESHSDTRFQDSTRCLWDAQRQCAELLAFSFVEQIALLFVSTGWLPFVTDAFPQKMACPKDYPCRSKELLWQSGYGDSPFLRHRVAASDVVHMHIVVFLKTMFIFSLSL